MNDDKEKDEIQEIFNRALERQDQKDLEEEENAEEEIPNTHHAEYIAPSVAIALALASLFDVVWFAAYFGLLFSCIGLYVCKKKNEYVEIKGTIIYNVVAFALCILLGGLWIVMYISKKM
ncbi:MAG: hypothetical protein K6E24_00650 [bacterium]|nr:hypothetical protein [bacterium]